MTAEKQFFKANLNGKIKEANLENINERMRKFMKSENAIIELNSANMASQKQRFEIRISFRHFCRFDNISEIIYREVTN